MAPRDLIRLSWDAVSAHRLRSGLSMLGITIGIASVILLTSIGEGARWFIVSEFTQFGTNLLSIQPGNIRTTGVPGSVVSTIRKLTIEDAEALRRVAGVLHYVPLVVANARVEGNGRGRSVSVYGVNSEVPEVWKFGVRQGRFLPPGDPRRGAPVAVLGPKLRRELFGDANALGQHVRIGGERFTVIGILEPKGMFLNYDLDDTAYIPVASAQRLINRDDLIEIDLLFSNQAQTSVVVEGLRRVLLERHGGEEDFTIITQTEMLDVLGRVLGVVSFAVGGIGAISLVVGAIGILTMMWISVNERTSEIGLVLALGASPGQVLTVFLLEAALLACAGGVLGVASGLGVAEGLRWLVPGLPVRTPASFVLAALAVSLAVGLLSGVLPARRAAALDPVVALHAE
jgi:putative ABC transport system permease protein